MSYYIDHFLQTRVSKLTYGIESGVDYYDSSNPEHWKRPTYTGSTGVQRISGATQAASSHKRPKT